MDFVWGCTFLLKKVDDLFLVVTLERQSKCKLHLNNFFHRPGGAGAPTAPPGYAYAYVSEVQI